MACLFCAIEQFANQARLLENWDHGDTLSMKLLNSDLFVRVENVFKKHMYSCSVDGTQKEVA
jgi:hypothetical protein